PCQAVCGLAPDLENELPSARKGVSPMKMNPSEPHGTAMPYHRFSEVESQDVRDADDLGSTKQSEVQPDGVGDNRHGIGNRHSESQIGEDRDQHGREAKDKDALRRLC